MWHEFEFYLAGRCAGKRGDEDGVQGDRRGGGNGSGVEPSEAQRSASVARRFAASLLRGPPPRHP